MSKLALEIIQGPNTGQKLPVKLGDKLGNGFGESKADIKIPSPSISSMHAKVIKDEKNQLVLIALNPSKFFIANAQKLDRVVLKAGYIFKIEEIIIKVVSLGEKYEEKIQKKSSLKSTIPPEPKFSPYENLETQLLQCVGKIESVESGKKIMAFKNPIQMRFTQGVQLEESFVIGWGPRFFGKNTYELTLIDPQAPDFAFALVPGSGGECVFSTQHPKRIFINGQNTKKAILNTGDKIKFGDTIIEILELDYF